MIRLSVAVLVLNYLTACLAGEISASKHKSCGGRNRFEKLQNHEFDVICHESLTAYFDPRRGASFATYAIHKKRELEKLNHGRMKHFLIDPNYPSNSQLHPKDEVFQNYDRGHLTPSHIQSWNQSSWKECYYMTNILPQNRYMNEQPWQKMEMNIVNELNGDSSDATWEIYTGGYWKAGNHGLVPDSFWKALCNRKNCSSAVIMATNDNQATWSYHAVNDKFAKYEMFKDCCPDKLDLNWKRLTENTKTSKPQIE